MFVFVCWGGSRASRLLSSKVALIFEDSLMLFIHRHSWVSQAVGESARRIMEFPTPPASSFASRSQGVPLVLWSRPGSTSSEALRKGPESWLKWTERLCLCAGAEKRGCSSLPSRHPMSHPTPVARGKEGLVAWKHGFLSRVTLAWPISCPGKRDETADLQPNRGTLRKGW